MTNAKKTAAPQPVEPKTYAVTPHLLESIQAVELLLAKRKSIDEKIASGTVAAKAAEAPYEEALSQQAEADANLALAIEPKEHVAREKAADAAADAVEAAQRAKTRAGRTVEALCRMAAETDHEIAVARGLFEVEIGLLSQDFAAAFADDLNEAIKPLVAVLSRGQALASATFSYALSQFVSDVIIPNPQDATGLYPLIGGGTVTDNGRTIPLSQFANIEPSAAAITDELLSIGAIRMKLASHRPFVHPDQRPAPYVVKGSRDGAQGQQFTDGVPSHEVLTVSSHR